MRILVAGVGNVFLGDDGFGVAVARRLAMPDMRAALPEGVEVGDFGIGGLHLAYELTSGYDLTILVDATPRGAAPGTLHLLEPSPADVSCAFVDAHAMTPDAVLTLATTLFQGAAGEVLLIGCEPADTSPGMELSPPVAEAVDAAAGLVREVIAARRRDNGETPGHRADAGRPRHAARDGDPGHEAISADPPDAAAHPGSEVRAVHEFGIAEAVVQAVERRAEGRPVRRVRLRAGALLRIAEPAMDQAFALVAQGTSMEDAALELIIEPALLICRDCGRTTESADPLAVCPACGGTDVDMEGGDHLVLESIQIAEAAHVPGHPRRDRGDPAGPQ